MFQGKPVFSNGPKSLSKNSPDFFIIYIWLFGNCILVDKLLPRALRSLETCVLVNNNLCGKLYSSLELPITFVERFKVTSVPFFISDFNFKLQIRQFYVSKVMLTHYTDIILKHKKITILSQFLPKNLKQYLLLLQ